jgi:diguanylate cyclase (GGDEF)-like protein/PAS domain S-box-containing protein
MTAPVARGEAEGLPPDPFRLLAQSAPIGVIQADADGSLIYVNPRWRVITGCQVPTPIPFAEMERTLHPDDRQRVATLAVESALERTEFSTEGRVVWPDGTVRRVLIQGGPVVAEHDEIAGYVGTVMDITETVETNEALLRSEERYRELIAKAPVGQAVYDLDGVLIEVNPAFATLLGYAPDELLGREAPSLVHPDDRDATVELGGALARGEIEAVERERRLLHKDGSTVWVASSITLERDVAGKARHFHSLVVDITERKHAERALRESEQRYRRLVDDAPVGQVITELDGTLVEVNKAFLALMGSSRAELFARDPRSLFHPDDLAEMSRQVERLRRGDTQYFESQRRLVRSDGSTLWAAGGTTLIKEGSKQYLHFAIQDITERRLAEEALRESEARFRTLTEALPVGVYRASPDGRLLYVNPKWSEITGLSEAEAVGRSVRRLIHEDDRAGVFKSYQDSLERDEPYHARYRIVRPDGELRWVSTHGAAIADEGSRAPSGFLGSIEDITSLVEVQEERARLASIVESTSDLVGIIDVDTGRLEYLNEAARALLGLDHHDDQDAHSSEFYEPEAFEIWTSVVRPTLERGETWTGEMPMRAADGSPIQVWQSIAGTFRADGSLAQVAAVGRDVTERRRLEAELAHRATHDDLTDLPNRTLLLDHLALALARASRDRRLVALLFLDLDRFKQVNDSLGHQTGDQLLSAVAERIGDVLRPADTVARLGGDEFVVLCEDVEDEHHAVAIAQRVMTAIEGEPFALKGVSLAVTASVGVALSAGREDAHPEALLRDADAAMYRAKDHGRARYELFDESMRQRAAIRLQLADDLAHGIEHGHIEVHFQPCVDLVTGRVVNVEALARWAHPVRGLLSPVEFISLAEETGLIVGLGLRVLTDACAQARSWLDELGDEAPIVHVNLSARQLTTPNLSLLVRGVLESARLPADRLCLEITESVLMEDASSTIETLRRLKEIGVSLGIDDFGTGYSSLSYLRRFPVDVLKVDRSFIDGLGPDPEDSAIVAAIVNLAQTLDLSAVAEGVETPSQLRRLRELGCAAGQGYLFAHPVPAEDLRQMLRTTFDVEGTGLATDGG